jgi:RNA polymerase sigma factor (sigma-70 family)
MPSDAALVRRARRGDRDAFAALVQRHHATLLRCCRRMVGTENAADAAQDAVVTALLSLDRLRDDDAFGAWLVGIGLNTCRALLRGPGPLTYAVRGSDPLTPHEIAEAREHAALVRAAIAELPRGQREAVTLFYLAGLTHAEAAEHLGIAPGAVKTRLKIWVGPAEAAIVAVMLEQVEMPRPGPHDLALALLAASGGAVREVRITRLAEKIFYAEVVLTDGTAVDARPSDAIPLALLTGAPLLVDPDVLDQSRTAPPDWVAEAEASTQDRRVLAEEVREWLSRPL